MLTFNHGDGSPVGFEIIRKIRMGSIQRLSRSAHKLDHRSKAIPRLATSSSRSCCDGDLLLALAKCYTKSQGLILPAIRLFKAVAEPSL